jgi:hypothetical protein
MKLDIISAVVIVFFVCVCVTLAAEAKTLFSAKTTEVIVAKAP